VGSGVVELATSLWPDDVKARLREYAVIWDGLWPIYRRHVLIGLFASMTWRAKLQSLFVVLNDAPGDGEQR
jgi:hypothetical protein